MKLRSIVLTTVALALAACGSSADWKGNVEERDGVVYVQNPAQGMWDGGAGPSLRFELEQVFGADTEPAEAILNGIGRQAIDVDDEGNVYIFDGGDDRLVSFASDGSVRWFAGGPGQGPAEFQNAEGISWNGGSIIYVTNGSGARVDSWSTDGEFIESRSISHLGIAQGRLVGVLDEHTVVLQAPAPNFEAGVRVAVVDLRDEGAKVADFEVDVSSGPTESGANMEVEIVHDRIAVGDWDSYDLRFFSREGKLERVVSRAFDNMVVPASMEDRRAHNGVAPSSWLKPPLPLAEGMMLAMTAWTDPETIERLRALPEPPPFEDVLDAYRLSFDLFDADGRYLTSLVRRMTDMGEVDEVDARGNVYTLLREPFPHVRRYRVEISQ